MYALGSLHDICVSTQELEKIVATYLILPNNSAVGYLLVQTRIEGAVDLDKAVLSDEG